MIFYFYSQFPPIVNLNVGGRHFMTSLSTLKKEPGSLLAAMFTGDEPISMDSDGRYFIDADPDVFFHILNYLRVDLLPPADKALVVYKSALHFGIKSLSNKLGSYAQVNNQEKLLSESQKFEDITRQVLELLRRFDTFTFSYTPDYGHRRYNESTQQVHNSEECPICSKRLHVNIPFSSYYVIEKSMAMIVQNSLRQKGYITDIEIHDKVPHLIVKNWNRH